jgi:hypothetical protein
VHAAPKYLLRNTVTTKYRPQWYRVKWTKDTARSISTQGAVKMYTTYPNCWSYLLRTVPNIEDLIQPLCNTHISHPSTNWKITTLLEDSGFVRWKRLTMTMFAQSKMLSKQEKHAERAANWPLSSSDVWTTCLLSHLVLLTQRRIQRCLRYGKLNNTPQTCDGGAQFTVTVIMPWSAAN